MTYKYPAIFEATSDHRLKITFPDLNCITYATDLPHAFSVAEDALIMALIALEDQHEAFPIPNEKLLKSAKQIYVITADLLKFRESVNDKTVKMTVTLPHWIKQMGDKHGANFSKVLQQGLLETYGQKMIFLEQGSRVDFKALSESRQLIMDPKESLVNIPHFVRFLKDSQKTLMVCEVPEQGIPYHQQDFDDIPQGI